MLQFFAEVRELPTVLGLGPGISTKEIGSSVGSPRGLGVMHCFAFREDNLHGTGTEPWQNPGTMGLTHTAGLQSKFCLAAFVRVALGSSSKASRSLHISVSKIPRFEGSGSTN